MCSSNWVEEPQYIEIGRGLRGHRDRDRRLKLTDLASQVGSSCFQPLSMALCQQRRVSAILFFYLRYSLCQSCNLKSKVKGHYFFKMRNLIPVK
ncbi:Uncharacterized protein TCM_007896 [Theobroma cacao]|uniref:Uncharacterized protein n=1 Tax=Theobroma cacao TaxID=3641 RepID=A0A061EAJ0_THECC|nr:Uncharacterized protein TCM_007896 [Theobroma cacao]